MTNTIQSSQETGETDIQETSAWTYDRRGPPLWTLMWLHSCMVSV